MDGDRVTLRNTNRDVQGTWDCSVGAVEAMRGYGWVPVDEEAETPETEPVPARKSRKES